MMTQAVLGLARLGSTRLNYIPHTLQCQVGKIWYPARLGVMRLNITHLGLKEFIYGFRTMVRGSLKMEESSLGDVPTCSFSIQCSAVNKPCDGETVTIFMGTFRQAFFGGILINPTETKIAEDLYQYDCTAEGYLRYLHTKHEKFTFTNMYSGDIVKALIDTHFPHGKLNYGVRIDNGVIVDSLDCDYRTVFEIIKDLAERNNFVFHITPLREVCFEKQATTIAPWHVTADEIYTDLKISEDSSEIRNRVIVRYSQLVSITESFVGDGEKKEFALSEKVYEVQSVTVNNVAVTYGQRNTEDNSEHDFSVQFNDKFIKNVKYTTLTTEQTLAITYTAKKPYDLIINDLDAQNERRQAEGYDGVYEYIITERDNILSRQAAIDRATAELQQYAYPLISASYTRQESLATYFQNRLRAGMLQRIDVRGRQHTIIVEKVTISVLAPAPDASLVFKLDVSLCPVKKDLTKTLQQATTKAKTVEPSPVAPIEILTL